MALEAQLSIQSRVKEEWTDRFGAPLKELETRDSGNFGLSVLP